MKQQRWDWLPGQMPGVHALVEQRRREWGAAWVAQCWERGVVQGEPGWWWAAEGVIAIGTPINADVVLDYHHARRLSPQAAVLDLRRPEGAR